MNSPEIILKKIVTAVGEIRKRLPADLTPKLALVLGSGLGAFADEIDVIAEIPYGEISGMPVSTVEGHKGRFVFGYCGKAPVVLMQGRVHYYEGYTMEEVVRPIRIMRMLGAEYLFLTNASGGINPNFKAGDLMLMTDQISSFVPSPLIGGNVPELGIRFPDMSEIYSKHLRGIITNEAAKANILIREGVYCQFTGPNYESPAEVRLAGILGADAVGMSTACEAIAAKHCGFEICGISCISNLACGLSDTPLSHAEVRENADKTAPVFTALVKNSVCAICGEN